MELENRKKLHKSPGSMSFLVGGMTILPKGKNIDTLVKNLVRVLVTHNVVELTKKDTCTSM